jgi:hypothetical protein
MRLRRGAKASTRWRVRSPENGKKILQKCVKSCLTTRPDPICCCPAETRTPEVLWSVLLFGLMGEPVSISQLIGSDCVVYRRRSNGDL